MGVINIYMGYDLGDWGQKEIRNFNIEFWEFLMFRDQLEEVGVGKGMVNEVR